MASVAAFSTLPLSGFPVARTAISWRSKGLGLHDRKKSDDILKAISWRRSSEEAIKPKDTVPARISCSNLSDGQIVYLPNHDDIKEDSVVHQWETHKKTFGHPALVVKVIDESIVEIMTITSLGDTPINEKGNYRDNDAILGAHLLIQHPMNRNGRWENPNGSRVLQIKNGKNLASPCYVRLDKRMRIETDQLTEYAAEELHLDEASTKYVQRQRVAQIHDRPNSWPTAGSNSVDRAEMAELMRRLSRMQTNSDGETSSRLSSSEGPSGAPKMVTKRASEPTFLGPKLSFAAAAKKAKQEAESAKQGGAPVLRKSKSWQ